MNKIVNAFHPDYIKIYMPDLLTKVRTEAAQTANGLKFGSKARASRESDGSTTTSSLSTFPKTKRVSIEPTPFHIYSRAGVK